MSITKLQRTVVDALEDIKAQDIRVFNTTELSDLFDRVVVASSTSNRQGRSLASHVRDKAKEKGFHVISVEGEETGEWVLVDLGDVVVHIMQPAIRTYYNLEELWGAKPVRMKLGGDVSPHSPEGVRGAAPKSGTGAKTGSTTASRTGSKRASKTGVQAGSKPRTTSARKAPPGGKVTPGKLTTGKLTPGKLTPGKRVAAKGAAVGAKRSPAARPKIGGLRRVRAEK